MTEIFRKIDLIPKVLIGNKFIKIDKTCIEIMAYSDNYFMVRINKDRPVVLNKIELKKLLKENS